MFKKDNDNKRTLKHRRTISRRRKGSALTRFGVRRKKRSWIQKGLFLYNGPPEPNQTNCRKHCKIRRYGPNGAGKERMNFAIWGTQTRNPLYSEKPAGSRDNIWKPIGGQRSPVPGEAGSNRLDFSDRNPIQVFKFLSDWNGMKWIT